jgi:hypothetical protein
MAEISFPCRCCQCWELTRSIEDSSDSTKCTVTAQKIKMFGHHESAIGDWFNLLGGCWQITDGPLNNCDGAYAQMGESSADCPTCLDKELDPDLCWWLSGCKTGDNIYTKDDMNTTLDQGKFIKIGTKCYFIAGITTCVEPISGVSSEDFYHCCETCLGTAEVCEAKTFILTDCDGQEDNIITSLDLATVDIDGYLLSDISQLVGQVVVLTGHPGVCWEVAVYEDDTLAIAISIIEVHCNCAECFGCDRSPRGPCGDCCFSTESEVIASFSIEVDLPEFCSVSPFVDICDYGLPVNGVTCKYKNHSGGFTRWWSDSLGPIGSCSEFMWVEVIYKCSTNQWAFNVVADTTFHDASPVYTWILVIATSYTSTCCGVESQSFTQAGGANCVGNPTSTGGPTGTVSLKVIKSGCCYDNVDCLNKSGNCDGKCSTAPGC